MYDYGLFGPLCCCCCYCSCFVFYILRVDGKLFTIPLNEIIAKIGRKNSNFTANLQRHRVPCANHLPFILWPYWFFWVSFSYCVVADTGSLFRRTDFFFCLLYCFVLGFILSSFSIYLSFIVTAILWMCLCIVSCCRTFSHSIQLLCVCISLWVEFNANPKFVSFLKSNVRCLVVGIFARAAQFGFFLWIHLWAYLTMLAL